MAQPAARAIPGGMWVGRWLHRLFNPELRSIDTLRRQADPLLLQPFSTTCDDRYPELFAALARFLGDIEAPRILSFGCSSGAEVRSLRRYIPHARIVGLDINAHLIARARAADVSPLSDYVVGSAPDLAARFDAVLAMAVFRHGDLEAARPLDCETILPFASFAEGLARLDAVLVPGGWLALYHAHFRLADLALAANYAQSDFRFSDQPAQCLAYGPDNRRIEEPGEDAVLFRKISA